MPIDVDPEAGHQRLPRRRGQEFLHAITASIRCRSLRAALTDVARMAQQPAAGRRLDDHAAGRQELAAVATRCRSSARSRRACSRPASSRRCRKDRILELYLNEIYLGAGAYGVAAAALTYFNKSLDELTLGEAAYPRRLCRRRRTTTTRPAIPQAAQGAARLGARPHGRGRHRRPRPRSPRPRPSRSQLRRREEAEIVTAPYFAEEVRRELLARYGEKALYEGGLSVRTSLDPRLQAVADKALRDGLIAYDRAPAAGAAPVGHIDPGRRLGRRGSQRCRCRPAPATSAGSSRWCCAPTPSGADDRLRRRRDRRASRSPRCAGRGRCATTARSAPAPRNAADVVKPGDRRAGRAAARRAGASRRSSASTRRPLYSAAPDPRGLGRAGRDGPAYRPRAGDERRLQLRDQPVQPRDPGEAAARLVDQAVRLSDRAGTRLHALDAGRSTRRSRSARGRACRRGRRPTTAATDSAGRRRCASRSSNRCNTGDGAARRDDRAWSRSRETVETIRHHGSHAARYTRWRSAPARRRRCGYTAAYAMLDNGGKKITPTLIDRVQDRNGETIFRADQRPCDGCADVEWKHQPVPVIPDTREQIADPGSRLSRSSTMLEGVVQRGTGTAVKAVGKPIAGKTGTTNDWQRRLVRRLHARPRRRRLCRLRRAASISARDETGGHRRGADLPRFHDRRAEGRAGDRIPHPARACGCTGSARHRAAGRSGGEPAICEAYKPGTEPGGPDAEPPTVGGLRAGAPALRTRRRWRRAPTATALRPRQPRRRRADRRHRRAATEQR